MLIHVGRFGAGVARHTVYRLVREAAFGVTYFAVHRSSIVTGLMARQAKSGKQLVVGTDRRKPAERPVSPLMLAVTGVTLVGPRQTAMQGSYLGSFLGHAVVTTLAAVGREAVHGNMAKLALLLKLGMGLVPAQGLTPRAGSRHRPGLIALFEAIGPAGHNED
jgi:hypothetical protein